MDSPKKVLVVTAHPDDVDFGSAGTVAVWTNSGVEVSYCIATDGDAGGDDFVGHRSELAAIRHAEQTAAAKQVGVEEIHWLGYEDGRVEFNLALRRGISRVIRITKPDIVMCQSPERNYERIYPSHPDHLATGEAAISAVYPDSRNPHAHPELIDEGFKPHTVPELWIVAMKEPNHFVDVTDTFDQKLAALFEHKSQIKDQAKVEQMLREWGEKTAELGGLPSGRLAEGFWVMPTA